MTGALLLFILVALSWSQEGFREFLREEFRGFAKERQGFEEYLQEVNREFEEYKRIVNQEFERFKRDVLKYWETYEATDRDKLVQYSSDYRVKRVFDFKRGELRIEILGRAEDLPETLRRELEEFVTLDKREAFRKDRVISNVERKLRKRFKNLKTAPVEKEPLLTPLVFGKPRVTDAEIEEGINRLLSRGKVTERKTSKGRVSVFRVKMPTENLLKEARRYKPIVVREAEKRRLSYPLIFAIIHTESHFNPLATSPVPAYGLMQIVPHTAGRDVTRLLFGKPFLLAPSYLYNAKNNIRVGTAYVYLLYYRYFKDVKDPESRLYCTIAAYNTGPGNVAYAFTGTKSLKRAIQVINAMSPQEVYSTLMRNLPYSETKDYLRKVSVRIPMYQNL